MSHERCEGHCCCACCNAPPCCTACNRTASRRFRSSRVHRLIQPSLSYNSLQRTPNHRRRLRSSCSGPGVLTAIRL